LKRNNYYKIQRPGGTAVLTVGQFIPKDWRMVKVEPIPIELLHEVESLGRIKPEDAVILSIIKVA